MTRHPLSGVYAAALTPLSPASSPDASTTLSPSLEAVAPYLAFLAAAWRQLAWLPVEGQSAPMEALSAAIVQSAASAVDLAIGLVGVMTLFLGLMKVASPWH